MKNLVNFLKNQKVLTFSTIGDESQPWITNVYFSVTDDCEIFFISDPESLHSTQLKSNTNVAFSSVWFDENNLSNRKGIQGQGECFLVTNESKLNILLKNHYQYYPDWKNWLTTESINSDKIKSKPYLIKPNFIKFWNDELYGSETTKEFHF